MKGHWSLMKGNYLVERGWLASDIYERRDSCQTTILSSSHDDKAYFRQRFIQRPTSLPIYNSLNQNLLSFSMGNGHGIFDVKCSLLCWYFLEGPFALSIPVFLFPKWNIFYALLCFWGDILTMLSAWSDAKA